MAKIVLEPYLFFNGNTREAMEFYKTVFGGELTLQAMEDVPKEAQQSAGVDHTGDKRITHAKLAGGDITLMATDSTKASPKAAKIELSLTGDNEPRLREIFDSLADGGKVKMELKKQFWGDIFGTVSDKFGVDWMVNITAKK